MAREFSTPESWNVFPAGLHVLAVDDDPGSLKTLEKMLLYCSFKVTTCMRAVDALSMLRECGVIFDILMAEIQMPEMNGLQLLTEIAKLHMQLPVILFSEDKDKEMIKEGISLGACLFLAKPFKMDVLKIIWQHVLHNARNSDVERGQSHAPVTSIKVLEGKQGDNLSSSSQEESDHSTSNITVGAEKKKKRFTWTVERQNLFVAAVEELGPKNAVPKKILEYMQKKCKDPDLDRHIISSHLQKFKAMNGPKSAAVSCDKSPPGIQSVNQVLPARGGDNLSRASPPRDPIPYISSDIPPMRRTLPSSSSSIQILTSPDIHPAVLPSHPMNVDQVTTYREGCPFNGYELDPNQHLVFSPPPYPTQQWNPVGFGYTTWTMPQADQHISFQNSLYQGLGCDSYNPVMNEGGGAFLGQTDDDLFLLEFLQNDGSFVETLEELLQ